MKKIIVSFRIAIMLTASLLISSCLQLEEDNPNKPRVTTSPVKYITQTSAFSGGEAISIDGSTIGKKGVCWSIYPSPTIDDSSTNHGNYDGEFVSILRNLLPNTTYYLRAYAHTTFSGTGYGEQLTFTTSDKVSVIPPCSPDKNSMNYFSEDIVFNSVYFSKFSNNEGYEISANATRGEVTIEFSDLPETGVYETTLESDINYGECYVQEFLYGNFYRAQPDQQVYVIKKGEGKYSVTFCDLDFGNKIISNGNISNE